MRYLYPHILRDLQKKMVFVAGPRQAGKTTLTQSLIQNESRLNGLYLNWDDDLDREKILKRDWNDDNELLAFDELHKFRRWKNWIKGIYDKNKNKHKFIVTGSARLDVYRKGGDSLLGRNHCWRLHPFSLDERPQNLSATDAFQRLLNIGGFPEPFLSGDEDEARRWRKERLDKIIKQDIRDLEDIRDLSRIELLLNLLRRRVGTPIVVANLAQDLQVAPKTVSFWIEALQRLYVIFVVRPYSEKLARALSKQPKIFFFDTGDVIGDEGAKFENFVATHLLKRLHFLEDRFGYAYELRCVRDKEKHDVDFVIVKDNKVEKLLEAKWDDQNIAPSLEYFGERLKPQEKIQIIGKSTCDFVKRGTRVVDAIKYFETFDWKQARIF